MIQKIMSSASVLILLGALTGPTSGVRAAPETRGPIHATLGPCNSGKPPGFELQSTIAFSSTRDTPAAITQADALMAAEIYLMNPDGTDVRRLTDNDAGDGFAALAPDGKKIVFDSNRLTVAKTGLLNVDDLFFMNTDGSDQTLLTRGSSASWSPDCKNIVFHASASYYASNGLQTGKPIKPDPGAATGDSDIFVANVDDLLARAQRPTNLTNTVGQIEDDPDWSVPSTAAPHGRIVFTAHPASDNPLQSNQAELYVMNSDGSGRARLTYNNEEERAPEWSPDGTRIVYNCRIGGGNNVFQVCVMNADGSNVQQLTNDAVQNLSATWSPDGQQIVFNKILPAIPPATVRNYQLYTINSTLNLDGSLPMSHPITAPPGINLLTHWGVLRERLSR
jgi:TolB protein